MAYNIIVWLMSHFGTFSCMFLMQYDWMGNPACPPSQMLWPSPSTLQAWTTVTCFGPLLCFGFGMGMFIVTCQVKKKNLSCVVGFSLLIAAVGAIAGAIFDHISAVSGYWNMLTGQHSQGLAALEGSQSALHGHPFCGFGISLCIVAQTWHRILFIGSNIGDGTNCSIGPAQGRLGTRGWQEIWWCLATKFKC